MTFYVHINDKLSIVGVSPSEDAIHQNVVIDDELAIKFLSGAENTSKWSAAIVDGNLQIRKNEATKTAFKKTDFSPLIKIDQLTGADVIIRRYFDHLTFEYSERFRNAEIIPAVFLTKRNDQTILVQNIDLSDLPTKVMIEPDLNISFYTQRSALTFSL